MYLNLESMATKIKNIDPTTLYIPNPVAEYNRVQGLQKKLDAKVDWLEKAFGVAYREQKRSDLEGREPQIYLGGKEYISVWPDDSVEGMCFFDVEDEIGLNQEDKRNFTATVNIVFFVNLETAYPSLLHRADAEARQAVINVLFKYGHGWQLTNVVKGVENVYSRYNWNYPEAKIDKEPFHVFALECEVTFDCYKY
jgi:hypothetical protein